MKTGGPAIWEAMLAMVQEVEAAIGRVEARLPGTYPALTWERITKGLRSQARQFAVGLR